MDIKDTFNWNGLPTELKDHVIRNCIRAPIHYRDYFNGFIPLRLPGEKRPRPCSEVIQRLQGWKGLIFVSKQVRAITLRLCFAGSINFKHGLCITSNRYMDFHMRVMNLNAHPQMVEENSLPTDPWTRSLAQQYNRAPKIYPELKQYATFMHGIRKIALGFKFVEFFHFFKVTAGKFDQFRPGDIITCDVFDRLPHLNEIVIFFPSKDCWRDYPMQMGPCLFDEKDPCLLVLYRILFERMAEALALYKHVKIKNLPDLALRDCFWEMRRAAMSRAAKFDEVELKKLYADCGGGVKLDTPAEPGAWLNRQDCYEEPDELKFKDPFYPVRCRCEIPCQHRYDFTVW